MRIALSAVGRVLCVQRGVAVGRVLCRGVWLWAWPCRIMLPICYCTARCCAPSHILACGCRLPGVMQRGVAVGEALHSQGQVLSEIRRDLSSCRSEFFTTEQAAQGR